MRYTGGCHCKAVRYAVEADLTRTIACNCSHCSKKGFILGFVPVGAFTLERGEEHLTEYRFNTKRIAHLFCDICGVQSFGRGTDDKGVATVAVNVRCLDGVDLASLHPIAYNGKDI